MIKSRVSNYIYIGFKYIDTNPIRKSRTYDRVVLSFLLS
jgi:hypothetical protein